MKTNKKSLEMDLCRTCLSTERLSPIFHDENRINERISDLFIITGVKIKPNDGITQLICEKCIQLINDAMKLRSQSANAEKELKKNCNKKIISNAYVKKKKYSKKKNKNKVLTISDLESSDSCDTHDEISIQKLESDYSHDNYEQITSKDLESDSDFNNTKTLTDLYKDIPSFDNDLNFIDQYNSDSILKSLIDKPELIENDFEKRITIEDLESPDEEGLMKCFKTEAVKGRYILSTLEKEKINKQRQNKISLQQEEKRKCMSLAVHPYNIHGPIKCRICSKELKNAGIFKCHAKTHFEPEFSCEVCGKKFVFNSVLRYHQQRVHGRRKRLACARCPYRAVDLQQLQNHERAAHTGERPYICDVCGDTFRMRNTIAQHMRRHFGVKNVQCERCPAMFRSRSELSWHRNKVHLMVYTYFCYLCPQTYRSLGSVKKHLLKVHGVPLGQHLPIKSTKERR